MTEPTDSAETASSRAQLQRRAVKGVAWTMIHTVVSVPVAFLVNLLLARVLAPEGYGRLAFLTEVITIAGGILALGLTSAMIQFGSKAHIAGRTSEVSDILSSSQGFRLLVVAPALTLLVLLLIDVPWLLLAVAIAFGVWAPAFLDGAPITLFIENKTATGAKITMVSSLAVQVGVVTAVLWVGTADSVWAARIIIAALGIGLALPAIAPRYRRAVLRPRLPRHFPPGFWRFAIPTGVAGLIGSLVVSRTEVLFLQWLSTPTQVGLFALAFGVSSHVFAPAQALTGPLIPAISGLREISPDHVAEALHRTLRVSSTTAALLVATGIPALALLLPTLYGEEFSGASGAVVALGVVGGLAISTGPVTAFVLARLSGRHLLMANVGALVVDIALALALIPGMGLWGAVIANAAGTLTQLSTLLLSEIRALDLRVTVTVFDMLPTLIVAGASVCSWWAAERLPTYPLVQALIAAVTSLGLLIFGLRATRSGLTHSDADALLRNLPHRLTRPGRILVAALTTH